MPAIIGVDEVGRGCWAGPLVAAAVLLDAPIEGLKDSKLLSKKRREQLDVTIREQAVAYGIGWVEPGDIDISGITTAVKMAMERAMQTLREQYILSHGKALDAVEIIVDGNINFLATEPTARAVIKADMTYPAVSAASIVAKVARDAYMAKMAATYPGYGFEAHVGYGTAAHILALEQQGVCPLHRQSFRPVKAFLSF